MPNCMKLSNSKLVNVTINNYCQKTSRRSDQTRQRKDRKQKGAVSHMQSNQKHTLRDIQS